MALVSLAQLLLYSAGCYAGGLHAGKFVCHYLHQKQDAYVGNLRRAFGLIINLKVHGVIYLLPLLVLLTKFLTVKRFLAASLLTAFVGGLPYLLPQVSLGNYIF